MDVFWVSYEGAPPQPMRMSPTAFVGELASAFYKDQKFSFVSLGKITLSGNVIMGHVKLSELTTSSNDPIVLLPPPPPLPLLPAPESCGGKLLRLGAPVFPVYYARSKLSMAAYVYSVCPTVNSIANCHTSTKMLSVASSKGIVGQFFFLFFSSPLCGTRMCSTE